MRNIVEAGGNIKALLHDARVNGFSMQSSLIAPAACTDISRELLRAGYLRDYTELKPTGVFTEKGMHVAGLLHHLFHTAVVNEMSSRDNHLPLFSVRVFGAGKHATTIHRNDPLIGPWAIGITLKGEAPFSVYNQSLLPDAWDQTIELRGDGTDPEPRATINAGPGSVWVLHTAQEQTPHSGGLVSAASRRELLILYGFQEVPEFPE